MDKQSLKGLVAFKYYLKLKSLCIKIKRNSWNVMKDIEAKIKKKSKNGEKGLMRKEKQMENIPNTINKIKRELEKSKENMKKTIKNRLIEGKGIIVISQKLGKEINCENGLGIIYETR